MSLCDMWPNFARSQLAIASALLLLHGPPGFGAGDGDGAGAGEGVMNDCVAAQALVVSPSDARERQ